MIEIEFADGSFARWGDLSDEQLERVYLFIEDNIKLCDTIGG